MSLIARRKTSTQQKVTGTKAIILQAMPQAKAIVIGMNDRKTEEMILKPCKRPLGISKRLKLFAAAGVSQPV